MKRLFLLDPFNDDSLEDKIFAGPYGVLQQLLKKPGVEFHTRDYAPLEKAEKVLFFNYNAAVYRQCIEAGLTKDQLVLFAYEPRVVIPEQYDPAIRAQFGTVFSFDDDAVDNKTVHKLTYIQGQKLLPASSFPPYSKRKYITLMNGNKYSFLRNELYSYRRKAIRYFERHTDFDLYGFGWDKPPKLDLLRSAKQAIPEGTFGQLLADIPALNRPYPSYRGSVDDKHATVAGYKFNLCFENEKEVRGYITEKLFDSFVAGCVPIYLGASNIDQYVPPATYIDMRKFSGFQELDEYLQAMPEAEWRAYFDAGQAYLHSKDFESWRPEAVFTGYLPILG